MTTNALDVQVTLRGGIFHGNIPRSVNDAIVFEVLEKVQARTMRQGKGLGAQRNTITPTRAPELALLVRSTRNYPRTRGTSWVRKNIAAIKAMAPRVANACAKRIAAEMGRAA